MLPFGPYRPDVATTNPGVSKHVWNVNPRKDSSGISYHPRRALGVVGGAEALPAEPRGSLAVVKRSGEFKGYFGTASSLYELDSAYQFVEIGTGYTLTTGHSWGACQYGEHVIFTNTTDGMLDYDIELGGSIVDVTEGPAARFVFVWAEMVIALDCDGDNRLVGSSRVDLQACKLEYSIVSPK